VIFAFRNVDAPNGDFGLTRQEGDEEFVVLTKAEAEFYKAALTYHAVLNQHAEEVKRLRSATTRKAMERMEAEGMRAHDALMAKGDALSKVSP